MNWTDPKQVLGMKRDPFQVDQVDPRRSPTEYMIQYIDDRWRRVYAKWKGAPYIVILHNEIMIDAETSHKLFMTPPREWTVDELEQAWTEAHIENEVHDHFQRHPKDLDGLRRLYQQEPFSDDDIPF